MSKTRTTILGAPGPALDGGGSALLLVAHGAADASASASQHAAAIAGSGCFAEVRTACLKGTPGLEATLAEIASARIYLVPLLMAEGYSYGMLCSRTTAAAAGRDVTLCRPVGANPHLADLIADMARASCRAQGWAPDESALVLVGHGTARHRGSTATAEAQVARIAATGAFAQVATAFLEEPPDLAQRLHDLAPQPTVVVGFFVDRGVHGEADVPRLIQAAGLPAAYCGPVGDRPELVEIIMAQATGSMRNTG